MERLVAERGAPEHIRGDDVSDNGSEFIARILQLAGSAPGQDALYRTRQSLAEWARRELQRFVARRMPRP
jgi:hypothetical protein